ncbi:MAG: two-component regulator propeller domain-containing protein [bacterium]
MKPGPRFQFNVWPPRHEETTKWTGCAHSHTKWRDRPQTIMRELFGAAIMVMAFLSLALSTSDLIGQTAAPFILDPSKAITQYSHDVWQYDQGLPQSAIQALTQTPDGYIWIGFEEGLARFDGVQFTLFQKANTPAITYNNIFALTVARDSSLWFGTNGGGLIRLKAGKFAAFTTNEGLSNDIVRAIHEDQQGNLWIGTNGGLNCFKNGTFTVYATKEGLRNNVVQAIYQDRQSNLWVGTSGGGLACLKNGQFIHHTTAAGLASDIVTAIYEDKAGNLWVGTYGGLNRWRNGAFALYTTSDGLANNFVRTIYEDRAGSLWIGTNGGGLNRLYNERLETFATKDGLSNDFVRAICEDREGSLWIGTYGGGLNRLRDGKFTNYSTSHGLSNNMVWSIYEDKNSNLWLGTDRGLNRFKDGKITVYSTPEGVPAHVITALFEDRAGNLWIGTDGGGLVRKRDAAFTVFTTQRGLSNNFVRFIHEDKTGNLWVGTDAGLNHFEDGKFKVYTTTDGLSNNELTCAYEDRAGNIWIGTRTGGLNRFTDGKFTVYTVHDGLASDLVRCLYEDAEGNLWIGTNGGGLSRYKDGKFFSFTAKEGLFDDVMFQILEDSQGNFWMNSNRGIFRVNKHELNDFADGKIKSLTSVAYGKADGMKTNECNGGLGQPSTWETSDGKLWFSTIAGVAMIDPGHIKVNTLPPPVVIEQVTINRSPVSMEGKLQLSPESKNFEFHYAGLSFLAPQKVQFKYKLEGYDEEWVEAGTRRAAYYTNISPGDYTFRVIACNNDGVWNEAGASLAFHLKTFFYQTDLFYFLCLVALVVTGASAYRFRARQIRSRETQEALRQANEALETRVQERTTDLMRSNEALRQGEEQIRGLNEKLEQRVLERTAELSATNVVLEREIAERKRAQEYLQYRIELEQFVAAISTQFVNLSLAQIDDAINWALKKLGGLTGVDRSYIFQFHDDGNVMDNTHEWCAEGVEPQIQFLQGQEIAPFPWAAEKMARHEVLNITRVSELPPEAGAEQAMFQAQGIQSVMNIPMVYGEKLIGLIGFDAVRHERFWTDELVASLRIVGEIFANALERKRAERALRESEERLLQLAENINEVLWMESVDANRLIYVSPVYEKIWGRSRESLLAQPSAFIDYMHPDDRERFKTHLGKQRRGEISEMEYRIFLPDGSTRWIWDRGFPIRNGDGHVYRSAGISEDITERKLTEAALQKRTERTIHHQAALLELAKIDHTDLPAAQKRIIEVDAKTLNVERVSIWFFNQSRSEIVCEHLYNLSQGIYEAGLRLQAKDYPNYFQAVEDNHLIPANDARRDPRTCEFTEGYLEPFGITSMLDVAIWHQGKVVGIVCHEHIGQPREWSLEEQDFATSIADVMALSLEASKRKQAQNQLREYTEGLEKLVEKRTNEITELERQRAESEKLATTGRMAARIAHEINNPLAGIKNSFLLLKDAIPGTHPHYEYVGRIEREIDRIARIIRQMFDLYRQEQDEVRRFRADDAIHDVIALLEPSFREHSVKCEVDVEKAAVVVALPEGLLRQVLYNIIQNAIEASPAGGGVKVAATVTGNVMNISIADQGSGISEEARSRIFEPFFTTKSKLTTGGLGLGLSVSKSLVESMRGTLTFETQIGAGTIFRIMLPL